MKQKRINRTVVGVWDLEEGKNYSEKLQSEFINRR